MTPNAELKMTGVCSYGRNFEVQAAIIVEGVTARTFHWSTFSTMEAAYTFADGFNALFNFEPVSRGEEPCPTPTNS